MSCHGNITSGEGQSRADFRRGLELDGVYEMTRSCFIEFRDGREKTITMSVEVGDGHRIVDIVELGWRLEQRWGETATPASSVDGVRVE